MGRLVMTRLGFVALSLLIGCQKRVTPPPPQTVELAGVSATYRDYQKDKLDVCQLEDPKQFVAELEAMNELLLKFLDQTSGGAEGAWSTEQARALEEAQQKLPPALDAHDAAIRASYRCAFPPAVNLRDPQRKGEELVRQSRKRLGDPELLAAARTAVELAKWKERQPEEQKSAREQWCPPKVKRGSPDIFYVSNDETGRTEYLFCDGSKVVSAAEGEKPQYVAPDSKKLPVKPYLDAAAGWPQAEIQRAPRLPKKEEPPAEEEKPKEAPPAEE